MSTTFFFGWILFFLTFSCSQPPPPWASYFEPGEFQKVRTALDAAAQASGDQILWEAGLWQNGTSTWKIDELVGDCYYHSSEEFTGMALSFYSNQLDLDGVLKRSPIPFQRISSLLGVRLVAGAETSNRDAWICREDFPGMLSVLVYEASGGSRHVSKKDAAGWTVNINELFDRAGRNQLEKTTNLMMVSTVSPLPGFDSANYLNIFAPFAGPVGALFPEKLLTNALPHGALIAIPSRRSLLIKPTDTRSFLIAANGLIDEARELFKNSPQQLAPTLGWWYAGRFFPIDYRTQSDGTHRMDLPLKLSNLLHSPEFIKRPIL